MYPSRSNQIFKSKSIPDPKIPANPVPVENGATSLLGNPFMNPSTVDSLKAAEVPCIKAATKASQKAASNFQIVTAVINKYAQSM